MATDALLERIGAFGAYVAAGHSYYTVETHIRHLDEAKPGEAWDATTQILACDDKRIRVFHRMHAADGRLLATGEQMLLHVDMAGGRACPAAPEVLARLAPLAEGQRPLAWPPEAGRAVGDGR
jgi:carnitine 3-dehydrogenase